jgi:hypothetical protein
VCFVMCGCLCVGFVMCVSFGNMCTCIYRVLYSLYCVLCCLVYVYVILLALSVLPSSDNSTAVSNNNNNNILEHITERVKHNRQHFLSHNTQVQVNIPVRPYAISYCRTHATVLLGTVSHY